LKILVFSQFIAIVMLSRCGMGYIERQFRDTIEAGMPGAIKIVVMSDTHLCKATDEFKALCSQFCDDADMVIHLGDWERVEILNYLEQYPLDAVAGNMDDYSIQQRLPARKIVRAGPFRLGITHGWGSPVGIRQRLKQEFTGVDAIFFGHTHQPLILRENGLLWFNPGSLFLGRRASGKSIGVVRIQDSIDAEIFQI
jgi:uncharacterized protein